MKFKVVLAYITLVIVALLASACEPKKVGKDGYRFEKETMVRTEFTTTVVLVASKSEMARLAREKTKHPDPSKVAAFASYGVTAPVCTIYILDPRTAPYEPEFIGHEFVHCVFGDWHKIQQ